MKKLRSGILLTIIMLLLIPTVVLAQSYTASITVSETGSNDYTQLPVIATIDNAYLADSGYISTSGLDTRVLKASTELPHMLADDKTLFCSAVGADEQPVFTYTLGNDALDNFYTIVGYDGYVTIPDDAIIIRPDGVGTYTEFEDVVGDTVHWEQVDEVTHDDATTHVGSDVLDARDTFSLSNPSLPGGAIISKVTVYEWVRREGIGSNDFYIMIRSGSTDSLSDEINGLTSTWVLESWEWTTDPNTGVAWTVDGLNALEAGGKVSTGVDITQVYVCIAYSPSLELGNNFEIEQKGYVDTSVGGGKNLVRKPYAFKTYISAEGSITSAISSVLTFCLDLVPDSAGDYTGITTLVGASTHWEAVDDPPGNPDDETTYVSTTSTSQEKDAYNLKDGFIPDDAAITAVIVHFRFRNGVTGTSYAQPFLRLGTDETAGIEESETGSWDDFSEALDRPGGGSWQASDILDLQVAIGLRGSNESTVTSCTQVYVEVACILAPNAAGSYTNIASQEPGSGEHWDKVDELMPDDTTTYVYTQATSQEKDAYNLQDVSIPSDAVIDSVTVYFRHRISNDSFISYCQPFLRLGGSETSGTEDSNGSETWEDVSEVLARPGGGDWQISDFDSLQVAIGLKSSNASYKAQCTQVYVGIVYTYDGEVKAVTATGISSGEHTVKTTADGTNLKIFVADPPDYNFVEKDSVALGGVSVPDNDNDWKIMQNNVMPYMEFYKHTVSGTLIAWYQPNTIIDGTTLPDREGLAQDGAITWGSNPSGISVSVGGLESTGVTGAVVPGEPAPPEYVSETPAEDLFTETTGENIPIFYPIFKIASDNTGWPIQVFWITGALALAMLFGALAMIYLRSMLIAGIASMVLLIVFCSMNIIPWWILYVYIFMAVAFIVYQRVVSA